MDQGSSRKCSAVHNFAPTVTKFCVMWEGQALPHDTKLGNCRCEIVGRRMIFIWSLIHESSRSGLIKVGPGLPRNFNRNWNHFIHKNAFENIVWKMSLILSRPQCVNEGPEVHNTRLGDSWWRHQMETFSALLAICAGNSPVPGEFPTQRPVTRGFNVFFDLRLNKGLSKQSWGWWLETLSCSLWRQSNGNYGNMTAYTLCPFSVLTSRVIS